MPLTLASRIFSHAEPTHTHVPGTQRRLLKVQPLIVGFEPEPSYPKSICTTFLPSWYWGQCGANRDKRNIILQISIQYTYQYKQYHWRGCHYAASSVRWWGPYTPRCTPGSFCPRRPSVWSTITWLKSRRCPTPPGYQGNLATLRKGRFSQL